MNFLSHINLTHGYIQGVQGLLSGFVALTRGIVWYTSHNSSLTCCIFFPKIRPDTQNTKQ